MEEYPLEEEVPDKEDIIPGAVNGNRIAEQLEESGSSHNLVVHQTKDTQGQNLGKAVENMEFAHSQKNEDAENHYDNMFDKGDPNFD
mmetsp:Transcript_30429/g.46612  ORF Transcript_30429/g.46612 Transcript_30429/m.46612 type:complete len:87 (-) Transcript_30429:244-504(-)